MCIFSPLSVLKRQVHWSHLKVFIAGTEAGGDIFLSIWKITKKKELVPLLCNLYGGEGLPKLILWIFFRICSCQGKNEKILQNALSQYTLITFLVFLSVCASSPGLNGVKSNFFQWGSRARYKEQDIKSRYKEQLFPILYKRATHPFLPLLVTSSLDRTLLLGSG